MSISKIHANGYDLNDNHLFRTTEGGQNVFEIPMYQRPYVWGKKNWEALFNDIVDNEPGYFIGAIICIGNGKSVTNNYDRYEVVDGQQRLTTLSLFLAAIYEALSTRQEILKKSLSSEDFLKFAVKHSANFTALKNSLIVKSDVKNKFRTRVLLQNKDNTDDYFLSFIKAGLLTEETIDGELNENTDRRRKHLVTKAYEYLLDMIVKHAEGNNKEYTDNIDEQVERITKILNKVYAAQLVMITADSHSDANILFETLNHRGTPLTITDLIKNRLLSALEKKHKDDFETYSRQLIGILDGIKDISSGDQERFFRHSYNAFRTEWNRIPKAPEFSVGKRANLYESYIKMIDFAPMVVFNQIKSCAKIYPLIQGVTYDKSFSSATLYDIYKDLSRINGTTSYTLLLYLVKNAKELGLSNDEEILKKICRLLINFFVRHTFTDNPPANRLDSIFIEYIDEIEAAAYVGEKICEKLKDRLQAAYGMDDNDEKFKSKLRGNVYVKSSPNGAIRFVLVKLAEGALGKESVSLWKKDNKDKNKGDFYTWTIEHILPQTLKPKHHKDWGEDWVKMLANGDEEKASEIQSANVNRLGNLTLTAYNPELGNRPFKEKKDCDDGYVKSILAKGLNSYICNQTKWGAEQIQERTNLLADEISKLFKW